MSRNPVQFDFRELLTSSEHNQQTIDYITPGMLVCNSTEVISEERSTGAAAVIILTRFGIGAYPYNPAKSVYDQMRILWRTNAAAVGGGGPNIATAPNVQYTTDGGNTWTIAVSDFAFPVIQFDHYCFGGTTDSDEGYDLVDISGVALTDWFGWRLSDGEASTNVNGQTQACISWVVTVILTNSTSTPF